MRSIAILGLFALNAAAQCPIRNIELAQSFELNLYISEGGRGPMPVVLHAKFTNTSTRTIVGIKFAIAWVDAVADVHSASEMIISDEKVKPGAIKKLSWRQQSINGTEKEWLIAPAKILYDDRTTWQISPTDTTCFGQSRSGKLTEIPIALLR